MAAQLRGTIEVEDRGAVLVRVHAAVFTGRRGLGPRPERDAWLLSRPDETAVVVVDGWLRTGDIGHLDADGHLTPVKRSEGGIVADCVQARPDARIDVDALNSRCAESLSAFKRPKVIHVVEVLPENAVGKLDKNSLPSARLQERPRTPQKAG